MHSNAGIHQINLEWCCGDCGCFMAPECLRDIPLTIPDAARIVIDERSARTVGTSQRTLPRVDEQRRSGRHLPRRYFEEKALVSKFNRTQLECSSSIDFTNKDCRALEPDPHVPGERSQPECAGYQLQASRRRHQAGFRRH
jgi:hypothetical protein